jgi:hypothetical protein
MWMDGFTLPLLSGIESQAAYRDRAKKMSSPCLHQRPPSSKIKDTGMGYISRVASTRRKSS